jgi:hypothetical protein
LRCLIGEKPRLINLVGLFHRMRKRSELHPAFPMIEKTKS